MSDPSPADIDAFIAKWSRSGGHERGAGQYFLLDLCDLLGLPKPTPPEPDNDRNPYTFERRVDRIRPDGGSSPNWIDLYKAGHFVLETKQGVNPGRDKADFSAGALPGPGRPAASVSLGHGRRGTAAWDKALDRAHAQAERYVHLLPAEEGRPPFLIVCDVGHCFDFYAEFSGTGGQYEPFPDPRHRRVTLADLHQPEVRERFRLVWTRPAALDPTLHAARVTREVAAALADLAKSLERDGRDPQVTAAFLQRCLFTMFAEDVGLLPGKSFTELLGKCHANPDALPVLLHGLWREMNEGAAVSLVLGGSNVPRFNGGLFRDCAVLPLCKEQIEYLLHAARQDWSMVEPAIFGTLLERALDPRERHKLGAHYTPRSYVVRLVRATLIDPLRGEWEAVKIAAAQHDDAGRQKAARAAVEDFHRKLAALRVLDPACGTGNFLYVSLELLKRLEAEVLDLFEQLGGDRSLEMDVSLVRPTNFLGVEINQRAAAIAQIVLWIGYFQWHQRSTGQADTKDRPLLPEKNSIECRDAVLAYDERVPRRDPETNEVLTIWDGRGVKTHPVTGKEVPDESARVPLFDYTNPRRAEWPAADFIVGNPPFLGASRMRDALGDGYTEALRKAWQQSVPESADLVMFWWARAAELTAAGRCQRFGFITTNSIHQTFNRRVLEPFLNDGKKPLHLAFAIPDHPWIDSIDAAAVTVAMTVAAPGKGDGILQEVIAEKPLDDGEIEITLQTHKGYLAANLQAGADLTSCRILEANKDLSNRGFCLFGAGFIVTPQTAATLLNSSRETASQVIWNYKNGKDITGRSRDVMVIDAFPFGINDLKFEHPGVYQHLLTYVKPERDHNSRKGRRELWWAFGEPNKKLRDQLYGLPRYIATVETSKHRFFTFLDHSILPDNMLVAIAHDDAYLLGVLSSGIHITWALAQGGNLGGNTPRYNKSRCFETFPFPSLEDGELKQRIRDLGERIDAHRKARQAEHPRLTLTDIYNVLEKLRAGEALSVKEKVIHDQGLATLLLQLHNDLDAAVLEAYGWSDLHGRYAAGGREAREAADQELLGRLVALNHERAAEESRGQVRWLRPDYQAPGAPAASQAALPGAEPLATSTPAAAPAEALGWPADLSSQVGLVRALLPATGPDAAALSARFGRRSARREEQIREILATLESLGRL